MIEYNETVIQYKRKNTRIYWTLYNAIVMRDINKLKLAINVIIIFIE